MTEPVPSDPAAVFLPEPDDVDDEDQPRDGLDDDAARAPRPTALESLINALLDSGPDVADHVVRAAQELVLAAQTVIDAAERAVEEQQNLRRTPEDPGGDTATVHHLDRTE